MHPCVHSIRVPNSGNKVQTPKIGTKVPQDKVAATPFLASRCLMSWLRLCFAVGQFETVQMGGWLNTMSTLGHIIRLLVTIC